MSGYYWDAIADLPDDDPQALHARIVGWVRRAQPIADTTCMGCQPSILPSIKHDCGGASIPSDEVRFRCVCPQPECMRRQGRAPQKTPNAGPQPRSKTANRNRLADRV
ncbi:hypothetical protein [Verrucosispora sp. WMMC514]|uniref:hypothetical protein n=1 Tax=Verrucosispora sp. WMMC514 TaxID=3015156 RepID=UPI00248B5CC2|nr:hypothetical protein [Verrucosispora sp. WMMC514]WBB94162.1 hypothetical protein O7597_15035 [Verrucosispora sp. WMMC514]